MSGREAVTTVLGVVVLVGAGALAPRYLAGSGRRWSGQLLIGVLCGTVAALAACAPFVDLVPDGAEREAARHAPRLLGVVALAGVALLVVAVHRRRRHRAPRIRVRAVDAGPVIGAARPARRRGARSARPARVRGVRPP